ncbi:CPBP family intramembrane metalloprotease domain-containing protein [Halorubrum sp. E3]|uniref:CPBP family intramembrane metalloprotease domain-containing protein n=1 Tax=Halorubrum persicum TaxID=1383844 RepID=A0A2G1WN70_9EURY|nr:type II CAAX endopeptidase family protein [Halorubrum persicum]OYR63706.1 CPBP family intramembrane metalloprotease domain-containing protein [Halorubrum sp. E3]PHQ40375.1 CPBP family intramembrane metalloprotease domain-containing protein [Halorubrum persicum]
MSDPSDPDTESGRGGRERDEPADPAASDGGEPGTARTAVDTGDPPDETDGGSPLRAVGVAFGLGVAGILGLLAVTTVAGGIIFGVATLTGRQPSLLVSFVVPFVAGQVLAFVGVSLGYLRWRGLSREEIVAYLGVRRPTVVELVLAVFGAVGMIALALVLSSLVLLFGTEPAQNQGAQMTLDNPSIMPLMIAAMFLVVGPCEELLFRGVIQSRAREALSAAPAILLAAAVFAPAHVVSLSGGASAVLTSISILFVPSLIFGAVYEYTENLAVVALMHGLYNSLLLTIAYVAITYGPEVENAGQAGQAGAALLGL